MKKNISIFVLIFSVVFSVSASDILPLGDITAFEGKVSVYKYGEVRGKAVSASGFDIYAQDRVRTYARSKAFITLKDQSRIALLDNSILTIENGKKFTPNDGRIIFNIMKTNDAQGVQIGLQTTVIGVKGTTFLVDIDDSTYGEIPEVKVYLKEGELSFTSVKGDFKRYLNQVKEEYESFADKTMEEYNQYVKDLEKEHSETVKQFSIKSGTAININGNEVRNIAFDDEIEEAFKQLEESKGRTTVRSSKQTIERTQVPPRPYYPRPFPNPNYFR